MNIESIVNCLLENVHFKLKYFVIGLIGKALFKSTWYWKMY